MSELTPDQLLALRDVARAWPGSAMALIGASALTYQLPSYRVVQRGDLGLTRRVSGFRMPAPA